MTVLIDHSLLVQSKRVTVVDSNGAAVNPAAPVLGAGSNIIGQVSIDQTTDGTTNKVNTELPAARLAADNLALPTAPDVLATLMAYDGTTLDMLRTVGGTFGQGYLKATFLGGVAPGDAIGPLASPDSNGNLGIPGVGNMLWNGASFSYQRGNIEASLLASASRAVSTNSADVTNYNSRGVAVIINVTVEAAAETLSLKIQGKDVVSGNYYDIADAGVIYTAATEAPTLTKALIMYPGVLSADHVGIGVGVNGSIAKAGALPRTWRAVVTHSAAGSWTYSVSYALII